MKIESSMVADTPVHRVSGELTFAHCQAARQFLDHLGRQERARHIVELSGLDHADATGFGLLVLAARAVEPRGGSIAVRGAKGEVRKFLELARLNRIAPIDLED